MATSVALSASGMKRVDADEAYVMTSVPSTTVAMNLRLGRRNTVALRRSRAARPAIRRSMRVALCETFKQLESLQLRVLLRCALDEFSVGGVGGEDPVRQWMQRQAHGRGPLTVDEEEVRVIAGPPLEFTESLGGSRRKLEVLDDAVATSALAVAEKDLDQCVVDDRFANRGVHEVGEVLRDHPHRDVVLAHFPVAAGEELLGHRVSSEILVAFVDLDERAVATRS